MTTRKLMLAAILACALAPALAAGLDEAQGAAQGKSDAPKGREPVRVLFDSMAMVPAGDHPALAGAMLGLRGRTVKNAPYIAETVSERLQNLADGNQIAEQSSSMSYRDSAGRTRQELRDSKGELRAVTIRDVVAGVTWILHPQDKTAIKAGGNVAMARAAAESARARVEQMRREGKLPTVERKAGPGGEEIIVKRVARAGGAGDGIRKDVRIWVMRNLSEEKSGARPGIATQLVPMLAGTAGDMKWAAKASTRDLGTRDFDGVQAEGKLRSYEIPAGEVGNRNRLVVSDESWYAPQLQITVYTKHSDPRSGDVIFRVKGLKREEPAAQLFTVPSDYTVRDPMADVERRLEPKPR